MSQEPYFVGDWESACAMLQCDREECRIEKGGIKSHVFQEVLPYRASLTDVVDAWNRHVTKHLEGPG